MHYYQHNIGDFNKATRHLTRLERSIYRDLIELYYDDELPLVNDLPALCRKIIARTEEERTAVEQVLNEYFFLLDNCWNNDRCNKEINAYHTNKKSKSKAGLASAEARRRKTEQRKQQQNQEDRTGVEQVCNRTSTEGQQNNKQEPINKKQLPPSRPPPKKSNWELRSWINPQAWAEFEQHRREMKQPLTDMARTKAANQLRELSTQDQQAVIDMTIQNRWRGLFPEKRKNNHEIHKPRTAVERVETACRTRDPANADHGTHEQTLEQDDPDLWP